MIFVFGSFQGLCLDFVADIENFNKMSCADEYNVIVMPCQVCQASLSTGLERRCGFILQLSVCLERGTYD